VSERLAEAFVAGPWRFGDLVERGGSILSRKWSGFAPLVDRVLAEFGSGARPTAFRVAAFILNDLKFQKAYERKLLRSVTGVGQLPTPVMWPAPTGQSRWPVPPIVTPGELANLLKVSPAELDWLADSQARERRTLAGSNRRYDYRWLVKRSGSSRLVEAPRFRLRAVQRRLLHAVVAQIPPHEAAHGFRPRRSVRTFIEPHVGRRVVLKLDLRDFFPTISAARVTALLLTAGYPEPVARLIAGLATNSVPSSVWRESHAPLPSPEAWTAQRLYRQPHLPQGAPTSPGFANACCFRLDARLEALAAASGASYTRYADDLAFSGGRDFERSVNRFLTHASAVAIEEGFGVNPRKTRVMRQGVRQRVAGAVVNERPNIARSDYDTLKAILHNCREQGAQAQNRQRHADFRAHLLGRISHVDSLNPPRGAKLRTIFDAIKW